MKNKFAAALVVSTLLATVSVPALAHQADSVLPGAKTSSAIESGTVVHDADADNSVFSLGASSSLPLVPRNIAAQQDASPAVTAPAPAAAVMIDYAAAEDASSAISVNNSVMGAVSAAASASAVQDGGGGSSAREPSYTVTLNQDSFFGFYPAFNGLIPVNENMDFSFYGIFWTKPAFGLGQGNSGDDLWTEFGVGVNFILADGRLKVRPQIGITNGSLLSGGALIAGNSSGGRFLDGIVPSLTVNYSDDKFEAEYYGGYYAALRQRNGDAALDFLHTWLNFGYRISSTVSFGPHYEILSNTRNTYPGGRANQTYEWLGGYVQLALAKGFFARLTGGADLDDDNAGDFYKMSIGMSF